MARVIYLDSSILLEIYLSQSRADEAGSVLAQESPKVSSWLLAVEVPIVLRRILQHDPRNQPLLELALTRFDEDLDGVSLVEGIADVARRLRDDERFSRCRTLDALHASTALEIQEMAGRPVQVATFDDRLAELARLLGLGLVVEPGG